MLLCSFAVVHSMIIKCGVKWSRIPNSNFTSPCYRYEKLPSDDTDAYYLFYEIPIRRRTGRYIIDGNVYLHSSTSNDTVVVMKPFSTFYETRSGRFVKHYFSYNIGNNDTKMSHHYDEEFISWCRNPSEQPPAFCNYQPTYF